MLFGEWVIGLYCVLMLFYAIGEWRLQVRGARGREERLPSVSLLVALRNEQHQVEGLLEAVMGQDYPDYECVLIDDHSDDDTLARLQAYAGSDRIRVLESAGKGKKAALLTGLQAARGRYLLTTDADCRMGRSWMRSMVQSALQQRADMVIGPVRMEGHALPSLEYLSLSAVTAGSAALGHPVLCSGANLLTAREAYVRVASELQLDEASGDDQFLLAPRPRRRGLPSRERALPVAARQSVLRYCRTPVQHQHLLAAHG